MRQQPLRRDIQKIEMLLEHRVPARCLLCSVVGVDDGFLDHLGQSGVAEVSLFGDLLEIFDVTQFHSDNCNSSAHEAGAIAGVEKPGDFGTIHRRLQ